MVRDVDGIIRQSQKNIVDARLLITKAKEERQEGNQRLMNAHRSIKQSMEISASFQGVSHGPK